MMFGLSFAKNIKQKGVSMVEYAVMLAFVAVVAGVFMDDGGLKGGIQGSVDKVVAMFDGKKKENYKLNTADDFFAFMDKNTLSYLESKKVINEGDVIRPEDNNGRIEEMSGFSNWVFASPSKWFMAWTDVDLNTVDDGHLVKSIVYEYSQKTYKVAYLPVQNHKIQLGQKGDTVDSGEYYTYSNKEAAKSLFYNDNYAKVKVGK